MERALLNEALVRIGECDEAIQINVARIIERFLTLSLAISLRLAWSNSYLAWTTPNAAFH